MSPTPAPRILDSHIHLWPSTATSPSSHAWMTPGAPLTRQFSLDDYRAAVRDAPVLGAVYIETDRTLAEPTTTTPSTAAAAAVAAAAAAAAEGDEDAILHRAAQPLAELRWLRRLVEGTPLAHEGFSATDSARLWGLVPWAPIDAGPGALWRYLRHAEQVAGPEAWGRVKGFRFLLQGMKDRERFEGVVRGREWVEGLREVGRKGWCFDVGVDARSAGVWQVERAVEMVEVVNAGVGEGEEVRFVLNHLCKPDLEQLPTTPEQIDAFNRWAACVERAGRSKHVYMKLSGAFSELADQDPSAPWPAAKVVDRIRPWLDVLFKAFPPECIMFGSDWPVCNVRGPGNELSWSSWKGVVEHILDVYGLSDAEKDRVWYGTAVEAYRLSPPKESCQE